MNKKTTQNQKNAYAISFPRLVFIAVFMLSALFGQAADINPDNIKTRARPSRPSVEEEVCNYTYQLNRKSIDREILNRKEGHIDNLKQGDILRYNGYLYNQSNAKKYDLIIMIEEVGDGVQKLSAATGDLFYLNNSRVDADPYVIVSYYFVISGDEATSENAVTIRNYNLKLKGIDSKDNANFTEVVGASPGFKSPIVGDQLEEGGFLDEAKGKDANFTCYRSKSIEGDFTAAGKGTSDSPDHSVTFIYPEFTQGKLIFGMTAPAGVNVSENALRNVVYDFGPGACIKDNIPTDIQSTATALDNVRIFSDARNVVVGNSQDTACDVAVYDVSGRLMARRVVDAQNTAYLPVQTQGVYIVKVVNNHGVTTQRVMVR